MNRDRTLIRFSIEPRARVEHVRPDRDKHGIYNDLFELAYDMGSLALNLAEAPPEEGWDQSVFLRQNREDLAKIRAFHGCRLLEQPFAAIMQLVDELVAFAEQLPPPPPDGWLGIERIERDTFTFLPEMGLRPDPEDPFRYLSERFVLELGLPAHGTSEVFISRVENPSDRYRPEDILFAETGRIDWIELPEGEDIKSAADIRDWFTFVADTLCVHASELLSGQREGWERLTMSARERNRLVGERSEREYAAQQTVEAGGACQCS